MLRFLGPSDYNAETCGYGDLKDRKYAAFPAPLDTNNNIYIKICVADCSETENFEREAVVDTVRMNFREREKIKIWTNIYPSFFVNLDQESKVANEKNIVEGKFTSETKRS